MVELSIIIVNWNTKNFIEKCIESIYNNPPSASFEIIIVDNASTDGSQGLIKDRFSNVILIENNENLGFSKANNIGFRRSNGKYILFLNPDTLVHENTLQKSIEFMEDHKDAGIISCKHLNPDGSFQSSAFDFLPPISIFAYILGLNKLFKISWLRNFSSVKTVDYVQGSYIMIRREVFQKIGGFDENFFMYGEDADLCKKVWDLGWKVYYLPDISITHYLGGSSRKNPDKLKYFILSTLFFYKKHKNKAQFEKLKIILKIALYIRMILSFANSIVKKEVNKRKNFYLSIINSIKNF